MRLIKQVIFAIEATQAILRQVPEPIDLSGLWEYVDIERNGGTGATFVSLDFRIRGLAGRCDARCSFRGEHITEFDHSASGAVCVVTYERFAWSYCAYVDSAGRVQLLDNRGSLEQIPLDIQIIEVLKDRGLTQLGELVDSKEKNLVDYLSPREGEERVLHTGAHCEDIDWFTWARLEAVRRALASIGLRARGERLDFVEMQQLLQGNAPHE